MTGFRALFKILILPAKAGSVAQNISCFVESDVSVFVNTTPTSVMIILIETSSSLPGEVKKMNMTHDSLSMINAITILNFKVFGRIPSAHVC